MTAFFDQLETSFVLRGDDFAVTRETIRVFGESTLDFNPLHFDDKFMEGNFGKTKFGGVIMHGLTSYGLIARMLTNWGYTNGGILRRMEARWVLPVRPGDVVKPQATLREKKRTSKSQWAVLDFELRNQSESVVAKGEAQLEFPSGASA